jgi:hypothetical protein
MTAEGRRAVSVGLGEAASGSLGRVACGAAALVLVVIAMATMGAAGLSSSAASCSPTEIVTGDVSGLPAEGRPFASLYVGAAKRYRLGARGPAILASIHQTESGFGSNMGPSSAGAIGQMQFLPSSWDTYGVDGDGDGDRDPYDGADAIHAAANLLRASGAPGDWYRAIFAYNHADWYVQEILAGARAFGDLGEAGDATAVSCEGSVAGGPAELDRAIRVYEPARDLVVPSRYVAPGYGPITTDARLWADLRWVLETYGLVLTAGKETGHLSHGDGSAIDAVPAQDIDSLGEWLRTAERLARDLGWTPGCASSGVRPACDLVPAIEFIGYNGYPGHGDPAHTGSAHIHISWVSSTHGTPYLTTPEWMLVFPVPQPHASTSAPESAPASSSGPQALVVGDSLTVGSMAYLRQRLGSQVVIDAQTGRSSAAGLDVLRGRLSASERIVSFDLGTNDDPSRPAALAANLRRARELAGSRCLVVSTVNRPGAGPLNDAIERFAAAAPHVELVDWHRIAQREHLLGPDGIHATTDGYRRRADAEVAAMVAC